MPRLNKWNIDIAFIPLSYINVGYEMVLPPGTTIKENYRFKRAEEVEIRRTEICESCGNVIYMTYNTRISELSESSIFKCKLCSDF